MENHNKTKCEKCGFVDETQEELVLSPNFTLCKICNNYLPSTEKEIPNYITEKIDWKILETFRKSNRSISKKTLQGMEKNISDGKVVSRAPFGYKILNKQLVVDPEKSEHLKSIFKEFLESQISLTQLAKKYNLTTSGIKKILMNSTYIGKIKFADLEAEGSHLPLIDQQTFEKVQQKILNI
jgi:hypothetical protein